MQHFDSIKELDNPQVIIVVSSPDGKIEIQDQLNAFGKKVVNDYWFFA